MKTSFKLYTHCNTHPHICTYCVWQLLSVVNTRGVSEWMLQQQFVMFIFNMLVPTSSLREVFHKKKWKYVFCLKGGRGLDPKSKLFGCHFGNIEHFIAPHLDTRSGLSFPRASYDISTDAQRTIYLTLCLFVFLPLHPVPVWSARPNRIYCFLV